MITHKKLEDYYSDDPSRTLSNEEIDECGRFLEALQIPRDIHICILRFKYRWSYALIADRLAFMDEGTVRKRLKKIIAMHNHGEQLPACTTKDILYSFYCSKKITENPNLFAENIDWLVLRESEKFFDSLQSSRHKQICELRFVRRRSYRYIAMKLGYCDDGTIRRQINRLIREYDNKSK
jgi:hypothetical protein